MLLYVFIRGRLGLLFREKGFYVCIAAFILIIGGYYLLREQQQPGYLALVAKNELGGRFNETTEKHGGNFWHYYHILCDQDFLPWHLMLIPAAIAGAFARDRRYRLFMLACVLTVAGTYVLLSAAQTKLQWYLMPLYPFLSLIVGAGMCLYMSILRRWQAPYGVLTFNPLPLLLLLGWSWGAYDAALKSTIHGDYPKLGDNLVDAGKYLREANAGSRELKANAICGDIYPLIWYRAISAQQGKPLPEVNVDQIKAGMNVLTYEDHIREEIRQRYRTHVQDSFFSVIVLGIEGNAGSGE